MFTDGLRLAKSVQTSIIVCSFRSFWVLHDDHPQVFLEFRIRLSPHKLLTNQFMAKFRRALWVADTTQFCDSISKRICIFMITP